MKTKQTTTNTIRTLAFLQIIATCLWLTGCVSAKWNKAQQANTVIAYQSFLGEFPNSEQALEARQRIERLIFENDIAIGTDAAYENYLEQYPQGRYIAETRRAMANNAMALAKQANTVEAYEQFLKRFPDCEQTAVAEKTLCELRLAAARQSQSVAVCERFLADYPTGAGSDQLRKDLPAIRAWEPKRQLGEYVTDLCPRLRMTQGTGTQGSSGSPWQTDSRGNIVGFSAIITGEIVQLLDQPTAQFVPVRDPKSVIEDIRRSLDAGVDPNSVRIQDFVAPRRTPFQGGGAEKLSSGVPGKVVSSDQSGMTLLQYVQQLKFDEVAELLKAHGAK